MRNNITFALVVAFCLYQTVLAINQDKKSTYQYINSTVNNSTNADGVFSNCQMNFTTGKAVANVIISSRYISDTAQISTGRYSFLKHL